MRAHPCYIQWLYRGLWAQHDPLALCTCSQKATPKNPGWNPSPQIRDLFYYESQWLLASHRAFCSYKIMVFNYREKLLIFFYQHILDNIKSLWLNCIGLECLIFKIVIWKFRRELSWKNWHGYLGSAPRKYFKKIRHDGVCYNPVQGSRDRQIPAVLSPVNLTYLVTSQQGRDPVPKQTNE